MSHDGSDCEDNWDDPRQKPNCHKDGDEGADFYLSGRGETNWLNEKWTLPTNDLAKIYESMNLKGESAQKIYLCAMTMYGGTVIEKYITSKIRNDYDSHSAFLTEELDLWYNGGIEDMASNVAWKW